MKFTDTDIMPFGKHKGKRIVDVPDKYLLWLYFEGKSIPEPISNYIRDNLDAIIKNADQDPR